MRPTTLQVVGRVAQGLLAQGVTGFCPTIVTSPPATYRRVLPLLPRRPGGAGGAAVLGVHLEGPFLSPARRGAHNQAYLRSPREGLVGVYGEEGLANVSLLTLAPELPGAEGVMEEAAGRGVLVSMGEAGWGPCMARAHPGRGGGGPGGRQEGRRHGHPHVQRHGGVPPQVALALHSVETTPPRAPGLLGLLMREEKLWFGLIVDGEHVCPEAVRLVQRLHPGKLVLVTGGGGQVLAPWLPQMPSPGWGRRNRHAKWNDCVSFNAEG